MLVLQGGRFGYHILDMAMLTSSRLTFYSQILPFSNGINKGELKSCFINRELSKKLPNHWDLDNAQGSSSSNSLVQSRTATLRDVEDQAVQNRTFFLRKIGVRRNIKGSRLFVLVYCLGTWVSAFRVPTGFWAKVPSLHNKFGVLAPRSRRLQA